MALTLNLALPPGTVATETGWRVMAGSFSPGITATLKLCVTLLPSRSRASTVSVLAPSARPSSSRLPAAIEARSAAGLLLPWTS